MLVSPYPQRRPVILVFVDGLGLGDADNPDNPLRDPELDLLANFHEPGWAPPPEGGRPERLPLVERSTPLPHDGRVVATDVSLGITGLPQSATGQTALLTGVNGAEVMGRHYSGFPRITLRKVLLAQSVFLRLAEAERSARFANAFSPLFFHLGDKVWQRSRMGATSWANKAGGFPFLDFDDLAAGRAVFHDITHDSMTDPNPRLAGVTPLPVREPEESGANLAALARDHDFVLFEFFQTDKAGHDQDRDKATRELRKLERFLVALLEATDLDNSTVLLTSDHGNVEDLGTGSHTHNPVPTLMFGHARNTLTGRLDRLEAFTLAILDTLGVPES